MSGDFEEERDVRWARSRPQVSRSWRLPYPLRSAATAVLVVVVTAGVIVAAPNPTASAATSDGSDWSSDGVLSSDSQVTVRWDNEGNSSDNTVPRRDDAALPHTDGKTYGDVADSITDAYLARYGSQSPLGGLEVTVGQSRDLVSQAVQISFSGLSPLDPTTETPVSLQIFQCWGAPGDDGLPDPSAKAPDPETCQVGAEGLDTAGRSGASFWRTIAPDPLAIGGDWDGPGARPSEAIVTAPFRAVDGTTFRNETANIIEYQNPFFSRTTTNELSFVQPDVDGKGTRTFDMQTGSEAPGLGCGRLPDAASVSSCWLVIVPRPEANGVQRDLGLDLGAVAPSIWAQRMQVKLEFADVADSCPGGQARALSGGSALATGAMASWIPGVCNDKGVAVGYSTLGDAQARGQVEFGAQNMIFTTRPSTAEGVRHAPVALGAVVIGYTADQRMDDGSSGPKLSGLKLTPRLVAKLLTQTYQTAVDIEFGNEIATDAPWVTEQPNSLNDDPEFQLHNPGVRLAGTLGIGELLVESMRTDAADAVWAWVAADTAARGFLSGCPDDYGAVINPFYSTRQYEGCSQRATELRTAAQQKIETTIVPDGFVDQTLSYPSDSAAYPLPGWYQREDSGEGVNEVTGRTLADMHPRVETMAATGRNAFRATFPALNQWCRADIDPTCVPAPGKWKSSSAPAYPGQRTSMAITDAATAARYQLTTFDLCDGDGENCVGADTQSLNRAAEDFEPTDVSGVEAPSLEPDYAGGAYPLTMPVYAAVQTADLRQTDAAAIADALEYISTEGQTPGFESGRLPPGYAPLSTERRAETAAVVADLRAIVDPPVEAAAPPAPPPAAAPAVVPPTRVVPSAPAPAPAPIAPAAPAEPEIETVAQVGTTPPTEIGFPQLGLILGLAAAVIAGLWSPVIGRRRKVIR